jgi:hypothetical protein
MGRIVGGIAVGIVGGYIVRTILLVALAYLLGTDQIVEGSLANGFQVTSTFSIIMVAVGGIVAYLSGAVSRTIGKSKTGTLVYVGLALAWFLLMYALMGMIDASMMPKPKDGMSPMEALQVAPLIAPTWVNIAYGLVIPIGIAIGGLNKGDFDKTRPEQTEPPSAS